MLFAIPAYPCHWTLVTAAIKHRSEAAAVVDMAATSAELALGASQAAAAASVLGPRAYGKGVIIATTAATTARVAAAPMVVEAHGIRPGQPMN